MTTMNRLLLSFLLAFGVLMATAQPPNTFNRVNYFFGDSMNSSGTIKSMVAVGNEYFMSVDAFSDSFLYTSYLVKTDAQGNFLAKSQRFGNDSMAFFAGTGNGLIMDSDSNFVLSGAFIHGEWGGWVAKFNRNLDTIWNKLYRLPDSLLNFACDTPRHLFEAIYELNGGGYVLAGRYYPQCNYSTFNRSGYLMKVNNSGNLVWRKLIPSVKHVYDINVTIDSCFVFNDGTAGFGMNKYTPTGDFIWKIKPNQLVHTVSYDMAVQDSVGVSVVPYVYEGQGQTSQYGVDVVKFNPLSGQVLWNKQYILQGSFDCFSLDKHAEIRLLQDGGIIVGGTAYALMSQNPNLGGYKGVLLRLSPTGDSLWSHYYHIRGLDDIIQVNGFDILPDGGFLMGGYLQPGSGSYYRGAWLIRTDSLGFAPGVYTVGVEEVNLDSHLSSIHIFPNPADDYVDIRFEQPSTGKLYITDMLGQEVYSALVIQQEQIRVPTTGLPAGNYFVRFRSKEGLNSQGMVLVIGGR